MKILVIRFSSIGDIVLTTPVLRCLKAQQPGSEIHYCTKKSYSSLLEHNPHIDKLFYLEDSLSELAEQLKSERYDWVIDLHNNLRTFLLKRKLGVPSMSFDKLNWQKWLLVNLKINRMPHVHIVDRYMKTVQHLAVNYDGLGLEYYIPPDQEVDLLTLPKNYQNGYMVYALGGQHETKKLPLHKMKELVASIAQPLVLVGGKEDIANGEAVVLHFAKNPNKHILNLCGKLNLNQSASIIRQSAKVFSHDTGMMHVAAAFQKETVSIWGNTVPDFGMYPFQTKHSLLEVKGLSCRPCSKIGFNKCPKGHFNCMNLQTF